MLTSMQGMWIARREQIEPRGDLPFVTQERTEETMKKGRQPAFDQQSDPGDRDSRHDERSPDREPDVMRDDEWGSQQHGEPPPAQEPVGLDTEATVSHRRYRSGYEAGSSRRACTGSASRVRREWRQAAHQGGVRVEGRRDLRQGQRAKKGVHDPEESARPGQDRRQDAADPRSSDQ